MERRDRMEIIPPEAPLLVAYASAVNEAIFLGAVQDLREKGPRVVYPHRRLSLVRQVPKQPSLYVHSHRG